MKLEETKNKDIAKEKLNCDAYTLTIYWQGTTFYSLGFINFLFYKNCNDKIGLNKNYVAITIGFFFIVCNKLTLHATLSLQHTIFLPIFKLHYKFSYQSGTERHTHHHTCRVNQSKERNIVK